VTAAPRVAPAPDGRRGAGLGAVLDASSVVLVCGTGGVGKTTTAGVLAIEAARRGRRVALVTIDPARRLASTLGLAALADHPERLDPADWDAAGTATPGGELWAMMLDPKRTFDRLVTRHAGDPEQAERILANGLYRSISGALGGTQEYMAVEQLHELHTSDRFDLVVVDTPPSRHALDVLDAPHRLVRLLDNRVFRLLVLPTRTSMRIAGFALQTFLRSLSRVAGREVVDDAIAFFKAFDGMEAGFRERATAVAALLLDPTTAFVLVTSPRRDAVEEAGFLAERLVEQGLGVAALVVNRVEPLDAGITVERAEALASALADDGLAGELVARVAAQLRLATEERAALGGLVARVGDAPVTWVPVLEREAVDFEGLAAIGEHLLTASPPGDRTPPDDGARARTGGARRARGSR
jgi:anion-transporting  ArsA/GET3 family ATPase